MTTQQLREKFNNEFGLNEWPLIYEVDHETYANVCQSIFEYENLLVTLIDKHLREIEIIKIAIGPNNGIMFKNIELILEKKQ